MTAKAYLRQLIDLDTLIRAKQEDYEVTMAAATQMTQRIERDRVKTSRNLGRQEELAVRMTQIGIDIENATQALIELKEEARSLISLLEDNRYKAILIHRYINCRSWAYIAENMGYGLRHVYKIHGQALRSLEDKMAYNGTICL
jgi:DNA-directed RNA polymerase specialized sigma subunit